MILLSQANLVSKCQKNSVHSGIRHLLANNGSRHYLVGVCLLLRVNQLVGDFSRLILDSCKFSDVFSRLITVVANWKLNGL